MSKRIELTTEVILQIVSCEAIDARECEHCPLGGACLEYFTGDDSENKN